MKKFFLLFVMLFFISIPVLANTSTKLIEQSSQISTLTDWQFYEQQLVTTPINTAEQITIPHRWGNLFGNKNGYGTYITTVQFDESLIGERYALHIPYTASSYNLFFNGHQQVQIGRVATNATDYIPKQQVMTQYFTIAESELVIALQVANYTNMVGGAERDITIGPYTLIKQDYQNYTNKQFFILGGFLFMVLNVLTLFYFRRQNGSYLWIGLIGLFLILWYVFSKDHLIMDIFPNISWDWLMKTEILTIFFAFSCYVKYISIAYADYYHPKVPYYSMISSIMMTILALFLPTAALVTIFNLTAWLIILFVVHVAYISYCAIRDRKAYAVLITFTNAAFLLPFLHDLLYIQGFVNTNYYSIYGFFFFALGYLIMLNHQHTKKYQESELYTIQLEHINQGLEETVQERTRALREKNHQLELLTVRDGLTNIANRRYFDQQLASSLRKVKLDKATCSLIIFDIDFFKKYNDYYGHIGGDEILKKVAKIAEICIGDDGIVARYGGEEFAVILLHKTLNEALMLAEFIRESIVQEQLPHRSSEPFGVITVSVGVAEANDQTSDVKKFIAQADAALYHAKHSGRNCVASTNNVSLQQQLS